MSLLLMGLLMEQDYFTNINTLTFTNINTLTEL
jgi:hypothetical protein